MFMQTPLWHIAMPSGGGIHSINSQWKSTLPPYSPDLNPIEQAFAKIKHWMRQAQKRTLEDTWRHIGHLVEAIDPDECRNYFAHAG
jgi:transposase